MNYIGGIERGQRNPSLTTLITLMEALNFSFTHLKYESQNISDNQEKFTSIDKKVNYLMELTQYLLEKIESGN